ncbi:MAG TPA: biosynthetic-type acetolactate synthase large subunit [Clostridiaceae bacterium]|nr:biosynthetic-type acetolactate synthase large subunit [Clostridiaceae bacterium]
MKITGAEAILRSLEKENIEVIFGYPGAAICPFYNYLIDSKIKHILTRHEQGAVHAASGYARITGKTGVCVATSGPGATNLITGIATAYMDSIPIVAITGQVPTDQIGKDVFQEADITGATAPFCKHNYLVSSANDLPRILKEAFHIASTGRPGPVLIDVPIDIQESMIDYEYPQSLDMKGYKPTYKGHVLQIRKISEAIEKAKAPVICAGGGIINADASDLLIRLAEKCRIPVTTTLMGIGAIPSCHELNLGMIGSHGSYIANYAVNNCDLLIIIGARVGDRAMGSASRIAKKAKIVHIDIDPAEIGKNVEVSIPVVGDARYILEELLEIVEKGDTEHWETIIAEKKREHPLSKGSFSHKNQEQSETIDPRYLIDLLSDMAGDNGVITTEVGQNQIWAANYFKIKKPRTFVTSGGMGTMGYGLPAAIGVKIGSPESKVITISGDGSFQMSMQELGTIKQYKLGIKLVILNNSRLGMVREVQKKKYCGRYSQVFLDDNPDFIKLAEAYGFRGQRINSNHQVPETLEKMLSDDKPFILECIVDPEEPTL